MSAQLAKSLDAYTMQQQIRVLRYLRNGKIGFDVFRNADTKDRSNLMAYIRREFSAEQIHDAITQSLLNGKTIPDAVPAQQSASVPEYSAIKIPQHMIGTPMEHMHRIAMAGLPDFWDASIRMNLPNYELQAYQLTYGQRLDALKNAGQNIPETVTEPKQETKTESEKPSVSKKLETTPKDTSQELAEQKLKELMAILTPKSAQLDETQVKAWAQEQCAILLKAYDDTAFNEERAMRFIQEEIKNISLPTRIEIKTPELPEFKSMGIQHKKFPLLLKACNATTPDGHHLNIWLKGPAGTGKTTAAKKCAEALNLKFLFNGAIGNQYELIGFIDAGGRYHRTAFREAYEHGGVYLFDEIDSSNPNSVLAFNAALANGEACFPDGMVNRHKDCVIIAGANTAGNGGTSEYSGRMKQDAAFLDRFVMIEWPLDEALEKALCSNSAWLDKVQDVRKNISDRKVKNHMVTPRASIFGEALLRAGITEKECVDMCLRKGLNDEVWKEIK